MRIATSCVVTGLLVLALTAPSGAQSPIYRIVASYNGAVQALLADSTGRLRVVNEALGDAITIGTTTVVSGTTTRVLFDNSGVAGEDADLTFNGTTLTATGLASTTGTITNAEVTGWLQNSTVNTGAPVGTDCDAAGETGRFFWDSTNDLLYVCSGASGWRKITTAAP